MNIQDFSKEFTAHKIELQYYCDKQNFDEYMLWYTYGVLKIDGKLKELIIFKRDADVEFDPTEVMNQKKFLFGAEEVVSLELDSVPSNFCKEDFYKFLVLNQNRS